ncbi:MAG: hypothetical protein WC818_22605, partial [Pseudomonas sp.]|uniref:hypothetical protein n=1 Tax=Pseudomonas sp. TaxID=306 RepID=UPI003565D5B8
MTDPLVGESCQTIEGRVERSCTILQLEESDTKAFSRHCQGSTEDHRNEAPFPTAQNKTPVCVSKQGFWNLILTMTYSHMGKPHTTIGDASF